MRTRGTQYTSAEIAELLVSLEMCGSMVPLVCWDNAWAESFFASLKKVLVRRTMRSTGTKVRDAIAEYIDIFYNTQRLHSALGYRYRLEAHKEYQTREAA
jgi:putative transposase